MKWKYLYSVLLILCCIIILTSAVGDDKSQHLPHDYVLKTKEFFSKEQWEQGKKMLDEGLKIYPDDPDMRWLMGRYYYQYKDYDQSRYQLIKCIEKEYNHVEAKQLLVNVEDETKHYSSAICYVNELLEVNPYWRGLWRRKIELYRKQGNDIEADRLLKRISQIYPDDPTIRKDLNYTLETEYLEKKKSGNLKEATNSLEKLIKSNPHSGEQYYFDLTNLYLQQGLTEKALEISAQGVQDNPTSTRLVTKKISILAGQSRYQEAMAFLRERMKKSNSPAIHQLYNNLLEDAARSARDSDPYILYGKIYATNKSKEALDFLLSTSLTRGYDEDARFYLKEAKKRYGANDIDILYKEYMLAVRMGDEHEANGLLQRLYKDRPNNYDIVYAMCALRLREAEKYMINNDWSEALPCVEFVVRKTPHDKELQRSAMEKMLTCYTQMKRYNEALATLDTLHQHVPSYTSYLDKKASLLDKVGRTNEALDMYYQAYKDSTDLNKEIYASAYEEMAIPYIKRLMQTGETRRAYEASFRLLEVNQQSDLGLHYAINASALLGKYDEFSKFTKLGITYYPNDIFYKIKEATVFDRDKKFDESLNLLRPELKDYPDSPELINAHSQSSEHLALQLTKNDSTQPAMQVLDSALVYDENNKELKYAKGLVYEKMKMYDSAYVFQKFYQPAIAEVGEYNQHLIGLQNKSFKNEIGLDYLHARFANEDVISSIASAEYLRKLSKNTYTGRINYKGMDGSNAGDSITGGTGVQLQGEWTHKFTSTFSGMANLAWANKYFPTWAMDLAVMKQLKNDWEATLKVGYRKLATSRQYLFKPTTQNSNTVDTVVITGSRNLFLLSPGISKTWYPIWANAKLDLITLGSKFYYNVSGQARFYLNDDGRTHISAMAGFGTFPEISVVDNSLISSFSHANTLVGLGGQLLVNKYLTLGILGTWYTYYNQHYSYDLNADLISTTRYKNLYNVYFQVYINF